MKRLTLIRHAKSSWKDPALADVDRPLSGRGKREAPYMGQRLKERGIHFDLLFSSPAKRARKTAKLIAAELGYAKSHIREDDRLYFQGVTAMVTALRELDDAQGSVALVGHNPDISALADWLTGESLGELPTAAVVAVDLALTHWRLLDAGAGRLVFSDAPRLAEP